MTFKDRYRDLQEMVRELTLLRNHNLQFKDAQQDQSTILMFAEAAMVLLVLERFLRAILGEFACDGDTLPNLFQKASSTKLRLITMPGNDREDAITRITAVRNTILHANFEQAAKQANCADVAEYFKKQFAGEVEHLFHIVDGMFRQIDPATGESVASHPNASP